MPFSDLTPPEGSRDFFSRPAKGAYNQAMFDARRLLLALLAAAGLLLLFPTSGNAACDASAAMPMMHHQHHQHHQGSAPAGHDFPLCATCVAVLPAPQIPGAQSSAPFAAYVSPVVPLAGLNPTLDPPPPRAA